MKKSHIINIGYPKCGTTWLWDTLVKNAAISPHPIKENVCLVTGTTVEDYCQQYTGSVTANFYPGNFVLDQYVIEKLSLIPETTVSMIIRNPQDLLWSLYNFLKVDSVDFSTFCYQLHDCNWFTNTSLIVERWKKYFGDRFHIFWYDDLVENNLQFYLNYCKVMNIDPGPGILPHKVNVTTYQNFDCQIDNDLLEVLITEYNKLRKIYK